MKINNLIERVKSLGTMKIRESTAVLRPLGTQESLSPDSTGAIRENTVTRKKGPSDLSAFREHFIKGMIHQWNIYYTDSLLSESDNVNRRLVGSLDEGGIEYFVDVYLIGSSSFSGTDYLGIDLHPDRFGWISNIWYEPNLAEGNYPVVAHSFSEWLERTLDAGPNPPCHYWDRPDFVDLGPAIPGDPNYKPRS